MLQGYGSEVPEIVHQVELDVEIDRDLHHYAALLKSEGNLDRAKEFSEFDYSTLTPEELNEIF